LFFVRSTIPATMRLSLWQKPSRRFWEPSRLEGKRFDHTSDGDDLSPLIFLGTLWRMCYTDKMKMVEAVSGMTRTYTFVFDPDPEGGVVVTCPALPGLVTHGATIAEARIMARDAMEGYIEVLIEDGEEVPESDAPQAAPRFDRLAHTLRTEKTAAPIFEQLSAQIATAVWAVCQHSSRRTFWRRFSARDSPSRAFVAATINFSIRARSSA
jgi:antitoxin HicB